MMKSSFMKKTAIKLFLSGFALVSVAGWLTFEASCQGLARNVVRLHVVAASDSPEDQAVKLKVRDAVLAESAKWQGDSMEETSASLCLHLESIRQAADRVLLENGFPDRAAVQVSDLWFPTREYGEYALPAGKYRALRVTIGEGAGKNWWCVVFPALCLPAAQEDPLTFLPEGQREIVENPGEYRVRFKLAELWEELRQMLDTSGK